MSGGDNMESATERPVIAATRTTKRRGPRLSRADRTPLGLWFWQPMTAGDWGWMGVLCLTGAGAHYMMIKAYEVAEASDVQPFALLQLVFIAILGLTLFDEELKLNVMLGAALVAGAAVFTLWRARLAAKRAATAS